ncbi:MAG: VOC family protein [Methylophaga sp.]|uniref:VOC family protein n=1 Tax=Methylophaga sp. TaxID=2024840 RepID=UPI00299CD461|nr:VOC family protein [Methylophaga sp.]MDX1748887.1 VOC family protein [Methylophaga sp.]
MKPYISMITLGVDDLHRSIRFYQDGMGLHTEGIIGEEFAQGTVAFFDLQPGLKLALWPRQSLAADAGLPLTATATAMSLAHNVLTETDVDAIMQQASMAGATIVKSPQKNILGWLCRLFSGSGWSLMGNCMESRFFALKRLSEDSLFNDLRQISVFTYSGKAQEQRHILHCFHPVQPR